MWATFVKEKNGRLMLGLSQHVIFEVQFEYYASVYFCVRLRF